MINVSDVNPVTDGERFTKKIVLFFPPLLISLWICAGDTREGEKRSNLEGDRWSFEGWLTDSSSYCYRLLCCLPSSSDKRGKGKRRGRRDEGWVIVTLAFNRNSFSVAVGPIKTVTQASFARRLVGSWKRRGRVEMNNSLSKPWKLTNQTARHPHTRVKSHSTRSAAASHHAFSLLYT